MAVKGSKKHGRARKGKWLILMDDTSILQFGREAPGDRERLKVSVIKGLRGWGGFKAVEGKWAPGISPEDPPRKAGKRQKQKHG